MASRRLKQVSTFIQEELGSIFSKELELPLGCLVTISKVETSPDLKNAIVWLSILPINLAEQALKIIQRQKKDLQRILNTRFQTKNTPQIQFKIDESEERAERITHLLDTLK